MASILAEGILWNMFSHVANLIFYHSYMNNLSCTNKYYIEMWSPSPRHFLIKMASPVEESSQTLKDTHCWYWTPKISFDNSWNYKWRPKSILKNKHLTLVKVRKSSAMGTNQHQNKMQLKDVFASLSPEVFSYILE